MKNLAGHRVRSSARFGLIALVGLTLARGAAVRGQSALDSFDPNANGNVRVVVVQPDGKILIGGDFTTVAPNGGVPVTRNHIARLNSDGTLDTAFNPDANDIVFSIVVQGDGKILAGGFFSGIGGQPRNHIARLDTTTGLADSFNPNADGDVYSIAVQVDGKILAGGLFSGVGGQPRNNIARLDPTTGLADSFNPNPNAIGKVSSIAVQADGKILAGGFFNNIGGQPRNYIARLDATTGLADSFDPNANQAVLSIAVQADGKILVGGFFTTLSPNGGTAVTRNYIARLETVTVQLGNISTRAFVQTGDNVMIGGFIITGSGQKKVIVRAIGPSLINYGITNPLQNPTLELHDHTGVVIAFNDNWMDAPNKQEIIDRGLAPTNNLESAILTSLNPGNYTAIVRGVNNGTGIALVEGYDLDPTAGSKLGNISTRALVQTGDNVMIGGFIIVAQSTRVIVRAIGPSLTPLGVPDALANPQLELHDINSLIGRNDDWQTTQIGGIITSDQVAEIQNSGLAPTNPAESAIIATLQPGNYTAIVRGVNNTTGNALVEVYDLQ